MRARARARRSRPVTDLVATMKHPLHTPWFFSAAHRQRNGTLSERKALPSVAYVEDFWALTAHLVSPSALPVHTTVYLFRSGLEPRWEAFPDGGAWSITVARECVSGETLDAAWEGTMLAAIGEQLHHGDGDEVIGCELSLRKAHAKMSLWTRSAECEAAQRDIAQRWRASWTAVTGNAADWQFCYVAHAAKRRAARTTRSSSAATLSADADPPLYVEPMISTPSTRDDQQQASAAFSIS